MKQILTCLVLCISLAACGQKGAAPAKPNSITITLNEQQMNFMYALMQAGKNALSTSDQYTAHQVSMLWAFADSTGKVWSDITTKWHPAPPPAKDSLGTPTPANTVPADKVKTAPATDTKTKKK